MTLTNMAPEVSRLQIAARVAYGTVAIPVAFWCLFILWAVAKMRYDGEAVGPQVPFLLEALLVPAFWAAGLVGCVTLFRRGKRWLPWAIGFLVPLLVGRVLHGDVCAGIPELRARHADGCLGTRR